jgi:hypothetical protein
MAYMILHADEVDYHSETADFEARGTVKVNFQNVQVQKRNSRKAKSASTFKLSHYPKV